MLLATVMLAGGIGSGLLWKVSANAQQANRTNIYPDKRPKPNDWIIPEGTETPSYLRFDRPFQQGNRCGPNAMFIFLRLLNKSVRYEEILEQLPVSEVGCSLEDLKKVGERNGVNLEVRQLTPEELHTAPKPLILHVQTPKISNEPKEPTGHFTVITKSNPDGSFFGVDTSNAVLTDFTLQYLARNFSGYALVPDTANTWMWSKEGIFYLSLLMIVIVLNLAAVLKMTKEKFFSAK